MAKRLHPKRQRAPCRPAEDGRAQHRHRTKGRGCSAVWWEPWGCRGADGALPAPPCPLTPRAPSPHRMNISSATRRRWSTSAASTTMQPKPGWPGPTPPAPAPPVQGGPRPPRPGPPPAARAGGGNHVSTAEGSPGMTTQPLKPPCTAPAPSLGRAAAFNTWHIPHSLRKRDSTRRGSGVGGRGAVSNPGAVPKNQRRAGAGSSAPCPPHQAAFLPRSLGGHWAGGAGVGWEQESAFFQNSV